VDMAFDDSARNSNRASRPGAHWQDWLIVLLSTWLFVSPWVLNFGGIAGGGANATGASGAIMAAAWNAWVLGVVVFLLALSAVRQRRSSPEWINVLLGAWIFVAPWFLGFAGYPAAAWDHWSVGAVIAILGIWSLASPAATGVPAE